MVSSTRGSFSNFRLGNSGLWEQGAPVLVQLQRPEVALGSSKTIRNLLLRFADLTQLLEARIILTHLSRVIQHIDSFDPHVCSVCVRCPSSQIVTLV